MSETAQFWRGEFGDAYRERNKVDWTTRLDFWSQIVNSIPDAESALEVGCNVGHNLRAIREARPAWRLAGIDIHAGAVAAARADGFDVLEGSAEMDPDQYADHSDLVFTAGVLIHIAPDDIDYVMRNIALAARKYVLCVEYEAPSEEEIVYRGHAGRLWRRPFAEMYRQLGLRVVASSDAGAGFDRCTATMLAK